VPCRAIDSRWISALAASSFAEQVWIAFTAPAKSGNHRALADIRESIEELRYYREAMLVPQPGPDRDVLAEIAARHQGSLA